MSSDEGAATSPVLPKDSDRGSSVSSELQDEYEELLRFAVVTPKFEGPTTAHMQSWLSTSREAARPSHRMDDVKSQRQAGVMHDVAHDRRSRRVGKTTSSAQMADTHSQSSVCYVEELAAHSSGGTSAGPSDRSRAQAGRSRQTSPDSWESGGTERFISEENVSKVEDILDTWSSHLKSNVLTELRRWRMALVEQHKLELRKERERCGARSAGLSAELGSLKELLHTYETSNQRKDEVIKNLSKALDRQKEKMEAMRAFTTWRIQHSQVKEEAYASKLAQQHYHLQLKRKVWLGWHGLVRRHWKDQVERGCRARAEEVCVRLSADYEARIAEHCDAVEDAQSEIQKLRVERDRYEESMKKAFMRGVCALNMEALTMFQPGEGRPEPPAASTATAAAAASAAAHHHHLHHHHNAPPPQDELSSSASAQPQDRPVSSVRFSPVHFDPPAHPSHPSHASHPSHSEAGLMRPSPQTRGVHRGDPQLPAVGEPRRRPQTAGQRRAGGDRGGRSPEALQDSDGPHHGSPGLQPDRPQQPPRHVHDSAHELCDHRAPSARLTDQHRSVRGCFQVPPLSPTGPQPPQRQGPELILQDPPQHLPRALRQSGGLTHTHAHARCSQVFYLHLLYYVIKKTLLYFHSTASSRRQESG